MTKAREAIARALCKSDDGGNVDLVFSRTTHSGDCKKDPWTCSLCQQEEYRRWADAAITALRQAGLRIVPEEPDEAMIRAGAEEMDPTWGYPTNDVAFDWAKASYAKMISAYEDGK